MSENPTDQSEFIPRIGTFLILLGIFFSILFLASDFAKQTDFDWLFLGILAIAIGIVFRRRAPPPPPAGRFALLRKLRENAKKRREEKSKKAQKK